MMLNSKYKPKLQIIIVLPKKTNWFDLNAKLNIIKYTYVTIYLHIGKSTQLTMNSIRISQVKN